MKSLTVQNDMKLIGTHKDEEAIINLKPGHLLYFEGINLDNDLVFSFKGFETNNKLFLIGLTKAEVAAKFDWTELI